MLPFLKKSKEASVSVSVTPDIIVRDSDHEEEHEEHEHDEMLCTIAEELISAVNKKDAETVVDCLRAAFILLDSEPHVEGEHLESEEAGE